MRMWNVNTENMCKKHLLGEHVEMHMFVGTINKNKSIDGYILNKLIDTRLIRHRHDELVKEMKKRNFNHTSELPKFNIGGFGYVDIKANEKELHNRCKECKF